MARARAAAGAQWRFVPGGDSAAAADAPARREGHTQGARQG